MLPYTPFVPDKLLCQEADRRGVLVDFLLSLAVFFRKAASQDSLTFCRPWLSSSARRLLRRIRLLLSILASLLRPFAGFSTDPLLLALRKGGLPEGFLLRLLFSFYFYPLVVLFLVFLSLPGRLCVSHGTVSRIAGSFPA